jgi:hypothetical protein
MLLGFYSDLTPALDFPRQPPSSPLSEPPSPPGPTTPPPTTRRNKTGKKTKAKPWKHYGSPASTKPAPRAHAHKAVRHQTSPGQRDHLMIFFATNDTPTTDEKKRLAREATDVRLQELGLDLGDEVARRENGMTTEQVRVLFNNACVILL